MFKTSLLLLFVLKVSTVCYGRIQINKYIKTCNRISPDVNECLKEAIKLGIDTLCKGIPELDIPPIDPFHEDVIKHVYNKNQISLTSSVTDVNAYGFQNAKVHNVRLRADDDSFHLEIDMTTPKVLVTGNYDSSGDFNSLKIKAIGTFNFTMKELTYTWKLDGKPVERDGETYIKIASFYMHPRVEGLSIEATNENPESKPFTELALSFVNNNWVPVYKEILPFAQENWNSVGVEIANKIFLKVPYDELFPVE